MAIGDVEGIDLDANVSAGRSTFFRGIAAVPPDRVCVGTSGGQVLVLEIRGKECLLIKTHATARTAERAVQPANGGHAAPISCAAGAKDLLVTGDDAGLAIVWSAAAEEESLRMSSSQPRDPVMCADVKLPYAVLGYASGRVSVFSCVSGMRWMEVTAQARACTGVAVHPSKPMFVTVGEDTVLSVWTLPDFDADSEKEPLKKRKSRAMHAVLHSGAIKDRILTGVAWAKDGSLVTAAFGRPTLEVFKRLTRKEMAKRDNSPAEGK
jgi:hypothetical protein